MRAKLSVKRTPIGSKANPPVPEELATNGPCDFAVMTRRFGHPDNYRVTRTVDGWHVAHIVINGFCDKAGQPFLFENLTHDSVSYPEQLANTFELLWNYAQAQRLGDRQLQIYLRKIARWVSRTEMATPKVPFI